MKLRIVLCAAVACGALVAAAPAAAQQVSPVHWMELTAGTSSSMRSTTYNRGNFKMTLIAYFGQVKQKELFLRKLVFKYTVKKKGDCLFGGKAHVWNSNFQKTYDADWGDEKCTNSSTTLAISRWFKGGQTNGKAFVAVEKDVIENAWCTPDACAAHRLRAAFYVP